MHLLYPRRSLQHPLRSQISWKNPRKRKQRAPGRVCTFPAPVVTSQQPEIFHHLGNVFEFLLSPHRTCNCCLILDLASSDTLLSLVRKPVSLWNLYSPRTRSQPLTDLRVAQKGWFRA